MTFGKDDNKETKPVKPGEQQEIIIKKEHIKDSGPERSMPGDVKAYFDPVAGTITVELYDLNETEIYIVDSRGDIIDSMTVNSYLMPSVMLSVPMIKGNYALIIDSSVLYGEGTFTVK